MFEFLDELKFNDRLVWTKVSRASFINGNIYPFEKKTDLLTFNLISFYARLKLGLMILKTRYFIKRRARIGTIKPPCQEGLFEYRLISTRSQAQGRPCKSPSPTIPCYKQSDSLPRRPNSSLVQPTCWLEPPVQPLFLQNDLQPNGPPAIGSNSQTTA